MSTPSPFADSGSTTADSTITADAGPAGPPPVTGAYADSTTTADSSITADAPATGTGLLLGSALGILSSEGFLIDPYIVWEYSASVGYYYVINQLPSPPPPTLQNSATQVVVSAGVAPPTYTSTVPNVIGMGVLEAQTAMTAAQINTGNVGWIQSSSYAIYSVTAQSIAGGTVVAPFTTVSLTACSGPLQTL